MKKFAVITLAVVLVGAVSIGAFAYRGGMSNTMPQNQMYGPRGGMMNNNQMPMSGGRGGMRGGRGQQFRNNMPPCGGICPYADGAQTQPGQALQSVELITVEKATEAANEFMAKYFPEYTVKSVEKDGWRPMYFATIQGPNGVEQVMTIHGFTGQVMHIFPKIVEEPAAE